MPYSLAQDHYVVIAKTLAATIGLEEAVLLQILTDCLQHRQTAPSDGFDWLTLPIGDAQQLMPFWNEEQIVRISRHLQNLGIIQLDSATSTRSGQLVFALNESTATTSTNPMAQTPPANDAIRSIARGHPATAATDLAAIAPRFAGPASTTEPATTYAAPPEPSAAVARQGATPMHDSWQPSTELLRKLQEFNGIPADFARRLVPEFVLYWRDRQSATFSWEARFMKHAAREWQMAAAKRGPAQPAQPAEDAAPKAEHAMFDQWQPSIEASDILKRGGVDEHFIHSAVPEFVLYWRDRGDRSNTWDSRFIQHIRRQWTRYQSSMQYDTEPRRIENGWQPSGDVYDILLLANIDIEFAKATVAEFVVYWRDTNQAYSSWNSRFLQHVKTQWARRHQLPTVGQGHGKTDQSATEPDRRSFIEKHTDRSWREGL